MTMATTFSHRLWTLLLGSATSLILIGGASPSRAQTVACMVSGEPVTDFDIEQRIKLDFISTHKAPARQDVINELIDEKVKIKEAKKFGVDPSFTDIEEAYGQMSSRMRITPDQLTKSLEAQGIRPDTLKNRIKADMVWTSLVRGRYKESLQVGEKDVAEVAKSEGDAAQQTDAFEARQKEAEALRARVQTCDEANAFFKSMQNAAIRDTVIRTSADIPQVLRELLDKTPIGHLTPPEVTKQGVEMVALCARNPTKIDTPKKKEIRDKMFVQKYEAKSKSYLQEVRRSAMIEGRRHGKPARADAGRTPGYGP